MRLVFALLIIGLAVILTSCAVSGGQVRPSISPWTIGFWFWEGSEVTTESQDLPVDAIYFHAGRIVQDQIPPHEWHVGAELPSQLPLARSYWAVLRHERQTVPSSAAISVLAERLNSLLAEARRRQISLTGLQLDIDAPTRSLPEYAAFLR